MPKAKAIKRGFYGGFRIRPGQVIDVTDDEAVQIAKRVKEKGKHSWLELVDAPSKRGRKPAEESPAAETAPE